jgi:hypothetical protein
MEITFSNTQSIQIQFTTYGPVQRHKTPCRAMKTICRAMKTVRLRCAVDRQTDRPERSAEEAALTEPLQGDEALSL